MTRLNIPGKCGIIGHQEAGQDSDQDFIYLPRQYLKIKPRNIENKAFQEFELVQNPKFVPLDMKNDTSIRLFGAVFLLFRFISW